MSTFAKPENALKRAEELINVGQKQAALQALHDIITSKRYRAWQKTLERVMFKYVDLCVDMRRGRFAKDGLIQYRIICQQVNVNSLEEVIKYFMQLSTERAEQAKSQAQAIEDALDVEDLEADKRPEDLMLSYVSGEKGKDRSDKELVTPWFKFLWETYRTVLEILRNNSKLEALYAMTAHRAFQFCKQYKRTTEFRRLCEIIRNHLANLNKYRDQRDRPDLTAPESLQLYLDTRIEQLKVATDLELRQEAFRSVEDIHGLMNLVKKSPKPSLMVVYYAKLTEIFWVSDNHLYHAYAWLKLFTLQKSYNKNLSQKDLQLIASSVLLASLAVTPYDHKHGASHLELENDKERNLRMASLINFTLDSKRENKELLSRSSLLSDLMIKGVMACVSQEVKDLYHLLEHEFLPLDLASKVQPLLAKISKHGGKLSSASSVPEVKLSKYVPALEKLATLRILQQVSQVYESIKIVTLSKLIPFFSFPVVEKISVDAVKYNFVSVKLDHLKGAVLFKNTDIESERLSDHLANLATSLNVARSLIHPPIGKQTKLGDSVYDLVKIIDKEHKKLLARKSIIEKRKEEHERQMLEMEREEELKRIQIQKTTEEAEQKRLAIEYSKREEQRIRREIEERELQEAQALLEQRTKGKKGKKPLIEGEKVTKQSLMELALSEQLKERQEMEKKLQKLAKTMDYMERAKREEDAPLIEKAFQQLLVEEKEIHEHEQLKEIELSRQHHAGDLQEKKRLARMSDSKAIFQERIVRRRETEYKRLMKDKKDQINQLIAIRHREREIQRKLLYYLNSEERRLEEQRLQEEARQREEEELRKTEEEKRKKEEVERKAKLDAIAERQRQRERELEEKERLRKELLLARSTESLARPPTEPVIVAASSPEPAAAAAPNSGRYVPKFRRDRTEAPRVNQPEGDRWGRQDDHPPQRVEPPARASTAVEADKWGSKDDKWRSDDRRSRAPPSSSSWSSSRNRG